MTVSSSYRTAGTRDMLR